MTIEIQKAVAGTICVIGGTGFVGRYLLMHLTDLGYRVRVISRHRERHRDLFVIPDVEVLEGDVTDINELRRHFRGCTAVINLAAILHESHRGEFQEIHVVLPSKIIQACEDTGVKRLLHMSALNADSRQGPSRYLRSKGQGEKMMQQAMNRLDITVFRPSVMFGPGDHLFNRFAWMLRAAPGVLPVVCANARMAPVYVGDVVDVMCDSLEDAKTFGKTFDMCGPEVFTLKELVRMTAEFLKIRVLLIGFGSLLSWLHALVLGVLPGRIFTRDNYLSLKKDAVCTENFETQFGRSPRSIETVVPRYLSAATVRGQYDRFRKWARRD